MSLFKKDLFEYKILERYRINIKKTNEKYFSSLTGEDYEYYMERDYCEKVAENDEYCFYRYKSFGDGSGGYILRQEKSKPRKIVFFGKSKFFNIVYNGFLFQVNHSDELRFFGITARNIKTGELHEYNWLSKKTIDIVLNGFGRLYCQDSVKDVFIDDGKLYFKISRKKSHEATMSLSDSSLDIYDDDLNYDLIVTYEKGRFIAKSVFYSFNPNEITDINNAIETIKGGGVAELSRGQIANILINLPDAKKKLTYDEFSEVYHLYNEYLTDSKKEKMDISEYCKVCFEIIERFKKIAPYEKFCGMDEEIMREMLQEKQSAEITIKAAGLSSLVQHSVANVLFKIGGSTMAIFGIISFSVALKYYFDNIAENNSLYQRIFEEYLSEIVPTYAKNETDICSQKETIIKISKSMKNTVEAVKKDFEEIDDVSACGLAAAGMFCQFMRKTTDDEKTEVYSEMFKTIFIKAINSLL